MNTNKFYTLGTLALLLAGSLLTGCQPSTSSPETSTPPAATEKPNTETTTQSSDLHALIKLIGQPDSAVVASLGEGEANFSEDTKTLLGRDYTLNFLDTEVVASALFDETENLSVLTLYLPTNDFTTWSSQLTSLLGEPTSMNENNNEDNGLQEAIWETSDANISLKSAYGSLTIEIFAR